MTKADREKRRRRRSRRKAGTFQKLKYLVCAAILIYTVLVVLLTGGSMKPFESVSGDVEASVDTESLEKLDAQELKRLYGLNESDYDGVLLFSSASGISAEEVLLVKVKSSMQMERLEEAIQTRLENQRMDFEEYAPEQARMIAESVYCVRGDYLFLAVSENAEQYRTAFLKSL